MNLSDYINLGWSVFPVKGATYGKDYDDSKSPLIKWEDYQTRKPTPAEVSTWMARMPKMSIGLVTGPINGFFVIDIDGNDWVTKLPNADFGITWKSVSKRGCHYFYKWEEWMEKYPTTKSKVGDIKGFDIRGAGGYVVAPNGNDSLRAWQVSYSQPLAVMPDWLREFLKTNLILKSQKKPLIPLMEVSKDSHNRHQAFLSYTGKLHRAGMAPADIIQILSPLAQSAGFNSELEALVTDVVSRYPIDRREKLRAESMQALLLESEPPLEWLIEGLWVDRSKGFIAGHPGVGKTWIALDMLLAVVTGGLCMGRYQAAYKAPCLLIEEEASRRNLQRRIHSLARARNLKPEDVAQLYHITQQFTNVPQDAKQITDFVSTHGIKLVVFDSLRAVHSAKENSSDDMVPILKAFSEISIVGGCSVVLIHHLAKSNVENASKNIFERMRGTGSLWAWRDCILGIEGEEDSTVSKCSFQFRDADAQSPIKITRHVGVTTGAIGLEAVALEESPEFLERTDEIMAFIKSQISGASGNQIFKAVGGNRADVLGHLKRLQRAGTLTKTGASYVVPN